MANRCVVCGTLLLGKTECVRCGGQLQREDLLPPVGKGVASDLITGVNLALVGARLTLNTARLRSLVLIPLTINFIIFALMVWYVIAHREAFRPDLAEEWVTGLNWLRSVIQSLAVFFTVVIGVVASIVGTILVSSVVNAPFLEWLSESVESLVLGHKDESPINIRFIWNVWVIPMIQALGLALISGGIAILLLILSFTGVLTPVTFIGGIWLTAITLCDVTVARKGYPVFARFSIVTRSFPFWFGLALPFFLVPFLFPLGVAGGAMGYLHLRRQGRDPT